MEKRKLHLGKKILADLGRSESAGPARGRTMPGILLDIMLSADGPGNGASSPETTGPKPRS